MSDVLIVEDDMTIADLLQGALEAEGYCVSGVARTVKEAMASAALHPPDFAVIDIRLADGNDGIEVGTYLRKTTHAGIIYSTGNSTDVDLYKRHGDAVMTKPYRFRDVGRGLRIIQQLCQTGQTSLTLPRNFRLLELAAL